jgi:hypothetical protein
LGQTAFVVLDHNYCVCQYQHHVKSDPQFVKLLAVIGVLSVDYAESCNWESEEKEDPEGQHQTLSYFLNAEYLGGPVALISAVVDQELDEVGHQENTNNEAQVFDRWRSQISIQF